MGRDGYCAGPRTGVLVGSKGPEDYWAHFSNNKSVSSQSWSLRFKDAGELRPFVGSTRVERLPGLELARSSARDQRQQLLTDE
jgi:hypothetical protein